jgi:hypothetical protein
MASPIEDVVLLLANAAEQGPTGLISALGIGWSITTSPTAPTSLILFVKVPWDISNIRHKAVLNLLDDDGQPVHLDGNEVEVDIEFETGRPPGLKPGTPIDWAQALNVPSIPLEPGRYEWQLTIDGVVSTTRPFTVRAAAPQPA